MKRLLFLALLLSLSSMAFAGTVTTIGFEDYPGYTQIDNQYASDGVLFSNALQLVVPSYDYFDYPPHSGNGVITNDPNDPIQVNFTLTSVSDVSGWYVDPDGVIVTAYGSGGTVLDTFNGAGIIGANAQFDVSGVGIQYITISDIGGNSDAMTVDDLAVTAPEPGSLALLGSGLLAGLAGVRRKIKG